MSGETGHICSGASIPSSDRPCSSTRAVRSHIPSLEVRTTASLDQHAARLVEGRERRRPDRRGRCRASRGSRSAPSTPPPRRTGAAAAPAPAPGARPAGAFRPGKAGRSRPGGRWSGCARARTGGTAPCRPRRRACDPSRRRSRGALRGEVRVLDRADAECPRHRRLPHGGQLALALVQRFGRTVHALGEQVDKALGAVAAPAGQLLPVRAEHEAEGDVLGRGAGGQVPGQRRDGEHEAQVERLLGPDDVHEAGRPESPRPVPYAGQVGRRVAVTPVGLAHDERQRFAVAVLEAGWEHAQRTLVLDQQAFLASSSTTTGSSEL